jgi:hypothetical protein
MREQPLHHCECPECQQSGPSATKEHHAQVNLFLLSLNAEQRRLYAGLEARRLGYGGERQVTLVTGLSAAAIAEGQRELDRAQAGARSPAFDAASYQAKRAAVAEGLLASQQKIRPPARPHGLGGGGTPRA